MAQLTILSICSTAQKPMELNVKKLLKNKANNLCQLPFISLPLRDF